MAVSLPLAIGLVMLLVWNAYLVYTNKTTVEHYEGVTARILASRCTLSTHESWRLSKSCSCLRKMMIRRSRVRIGRKQPRDVGREVAWY